MCILIVAHQTQRPCLSVPYWCARVFFFNAFLFINWKHDKLLTGPDGWSQRIEKVINFTGITTCQAVNTHRFVRLRAKMEQLSLLLGDSGARAHACTQHRQEEGSGDQLKSVIHYCQVHSLLKRAVIRGRRWKNVISKQSRLVTLGINRPFSEQRYHASNKNQAA